MKVFVYTKEQKPKKIATITDVVQVTESKTAKLIQIETSSGATLTFDTKGVKTTIYQN